MAAGGPKLRCSLCPSLFSTQGYLDMHVLSQHPGSASANLAQLSLAAGAAGLTLPKPRWLVRKSGELVWGDTGMARDDIWFNITQPSSPRRGQPLEPWASMHPDTYADVMGDLRLRTAYMAVRNAAYTAGRADVKTTVQAVLATHSSVANLGRAVTATPVGPSPAAPAVEPAVAARESVAALQADLMGLVEQMVRLDATKGGKLTRGQLVEFTARYSDLRNVQLHLSEAVGQLDGMLDVAAAQLREWNE